MISVAENGWIISLNARRIDRNFGVLRPFNCPRLSTETRGSSVVPNNKIAQQNRTLVVPRPPPACNQRRSSSIAAARFRLIKAMVQMSEEVCFGPTAVMAQKRQLRL